MRRAILVLGCSAYLSGCHKEPRLAILPVPPRSTGPAPDPLKNLPDPPFAGTVEIVNLQLPPVLQTPIPAQPPPPPREPRRRVRPTGISPAGAVAAPEPEVTPAMGAPLPRLGQILSTEERRAYEASIDESLQAARSSLGKVSVKRLTGSQLGTYRQVQVFVRQAEALRRSDLVSAIGLARKAKLLARELAASQPR